MSYMKHVVLEDLTSTISVPKQEGLQLPEATATAISGYLEMVSQSGLELLVALSQSPEDAASKSPDEMVSMSSPQT